MPLRLALTCLALVLFSLPQQAQGSDWEEDKPEAKPETRGKESDAGTSGTKLQGRVEHIHEKKSGILDSGPATVTPSVPGAQKGYVSGQGATDSTGPLTGKAIDDELRGMVKDGSLTPLSGLYQNPDGTPTLKGSATKQDGGGLGDPDQDDQELMVEWDRWRNRFQRAVQLGLQEMLNNPDPDDYQPPRVDPQTGRILPRFPLGTGAAFSCMVTNEGRIAHLDVIESSGFRAYDRALVKAIRQLEGTRILQFPSRSKRANVTQAGRIKTATTSDFQYHHYGDVERVRH